MFVSSIGTPRKEESCSCIVYISVLVILALAVPLAVIIAIGVCHFWKKRSRKGKEDFLPPCIDYTSYKLYQLVDKLRCKS